MDKVLRMTFASSLTELCETNTSFDTGILRICYTGQNRNNSYLSKEAIQNSLKTIYNCPIVCNYDRESDTLGGHDMEIIRDEDGGLRLVNITQPIGVIPESSRVWFEDFTEEDGTVHEYLYAEVLLWKRQEAYRKVKDDGITKHSMEINVKNGYSVDGIYHIENFEFTAFTLIGVEPCFEGSALEMFSKQDFKSQLSEMMQELKESYALTNLVTTQNGVDDTHPHNKQTEGGKVKLNEKLELAANYGINVESLDFSIDDFTIEELKEKFEAIKSAGNTATSGSADPENENGKFALTRNIIEELNHVLDGVKINREWGECCRYSYVDCDLEAGEVYCWDTCDWLLYGFTYTIDGDRITIDFNSKKRKKYAIVDFDEGEQPSPFADMFANMEQMIHKGIDLEAKCTEASNTITSMEAELSELRNFKADTEAAVAQEKREAIFAQFDDLTGVDAFETLRENCMQYDVETIEEKCYAIRGRNIASQKFSLEKRPKMKVEKTGTPDEPYGGLFAKYGIVAEN